MNSLETKLIVEPESIKNWTGWVPRDPLINIRLVGGEPLPYRVLGKGYILGIYSWVMTYGVVTGSVLLGWLRVVDVWGGNAKPRLFPPLLEFKLFLYQLQKAIFLVDYNKSIQYHSCNWEFGVQRCDPRKLEDIRALDDEFVALSLTLIIIAFLYSVTYTFAYNCIALLVCPM